MKLETQEAVRVPSNLIEAIRAFPRQREIEHCGIKQSISSFDIYAICPECSVRYKVRCFSGGYEIEDLFDAVFEWLTEPGAAEILKQRQQELD